MADLIQIGVDVRTNIKQATADLDKMGGSVVNNINTINRLESEVKQLNRELGRGRVSEAAYAKGMQQINNQLDVFQQRAAKAADVERRFGQTAATGGKSLNRFNMVLQQGGYQLQDFVVQLQSGTSFFTAFSQQGSQFASIFGPSGAVIGAIIAIGSAIGGVALASMGARKEVKDFQESLEDLEDSVKAYRESIELANSSSKELASEFGIISGELKSVLSDFKELARIKVFDQIGQSIGALRSEHIEGFLGDLENIKTLLGVQGVFAAGGQIVGQFNGTLKALEDSTASLSQRLASAYDLRDMFLDNVGSIEQMSDAQKSFYNDLLRAIEQLEKFQGSVLANYDDVLGSSEGLRASEEALNDIFEERLGKIDDTFNKYEDILGSSEGLAAAEQALNDLYEARLGTIDDTANNYEDILGSEKGLKAAVQALNDQYQQRLDKIADIAEAERKLFEENLAYEKKQALSATEELKDAAEDLGERLGISFSKALVFIRQAKAEAQMDLDAFGGAGEFKYTSAQTINKITKGSKKNLTNIQDTIDALREQVKHETKLLGLTGERLKEEEVYYDLVLKNKDADIKLSDKKLRAIAKEIAAQQQANEMYEEAIQFVDSISDAFSDFVATGLRDFKSFVGSIKDMFIRLLADMAAAAIRNRILIPIATGFMAGAGSAAAASTMAAGTGAFAAGGIGAGLAAGAAGLSSGFMGVMTGGGLGSSFANLGGLMSGSVGGMGAIGAAIPAIAAIAVVVGLFTKKVKQLDSGLRVTIDSTGTLVEQFSKLQTSRLFGLIKRTSTSYAQAGADVADPIVDAIGNMQQSIIDAAGTLGIGAAAFDNFSYQFKVSLKGLTEEEQLQKINEEITKMGDSFASLSGHFSTMNELLAAAQQRYDIETRLLGLLNNQSALLTRQREAERAATNELNRGLLEQVYKLEDAYSAVNSAFAVVQRSIEARKTAITNSFNEIMETIQGRIEAAQAAVGVSGGIVSSLEGAAGGSGMTRGAGLAYLRSLRGASRITDQKKLDDALQAIADPSQDLYTNFVDYQRDFQDQTNLVRELEEKAKLQLSTDEQTLLQLQEEAKAAQARYDSQIEKLDEQLANAQAQLDALYGIDTSVKSVTEAISALGSAINGAMAAQKAAAEAAGVGGGTGASATGKSFSEQYGTGSQYKGYDLAKLSGSGDLLAAAAMLGVGTTGKTGAQIQQAISNASGMAVRLDNATRSQQFAMGGMFGGGVRMVGERGPELEATGPSRIFSTKQTSELFRNPELVDEVRSLRSEVAGLRSENRQLQTSISKYSKRNYDINRKWDTDGLPATRT